MAESIAGQPLPATSVVFYRSISDVLSCPIADRGTLLEKALPGVLDAITTWDCRGHCSGPEFSQSQVHNTSPGYVTHIRANRAAQLPLVPEEPSSTFQQQSPSLSISIAQRRRRASGTPVSALAANQFGVTCITQHPTRELRNTCFHAVPSLPYTVLLHTMMLRVEIDIEAS